MGTRNAFSGSITAILLGVLWQAGFAQNRNASRTELVVIKKNFPGLAKATFNNVSNRPVRLEGELAASLNLESEGAVGNYLNARAEVFGLDAHTDVFKLNRVRQDNLGMKHARMAHYYKGVRVFGSELMLHADRTGMLRLINGQVVDHLNLDVQPRLSGDEALAAALQDIGATRYRWEIPELEALIKKAYHDPAKSWRPVPELVITANKGDFLSRNFKLAYMIKIAVEEPAPANWTYFIDANTGEVVNRWNSMHTVDAVGTGVSLYSGTVSINTDDVGGSFEMHDVNRNITTYDANDQTLLPGTLFTDGDNFWDGTRQNAGVDAHWGAMQFYDYYLNIHGRNSIDGAGMEIIGSVHYSVNYNNASWDGVQARYGDGDGSVFDPLVTVDIAAHEFTHGVTENESNLIYQSEPGALNESISDMFGTAVEFYAKPSPNWLIGEESYTPGTAGDALRYMNNPNQGGDPDTYLGDFWASTANPGPFNDWGGVHTNSGVPNFQFYLLSEGGSGTNDNNDSYTVTGIGIENAAKIWYRSQTVYLTVNSQFADARDATISAAIDLFGSGSLEHDQVQNAWHAVGVGDPAGGGGTPPADPSNLSATAISSSQIDLAWTDNSTDEDGFAIERKTGTAAFSEIASVGAGVTSFSDATLAASTTYTYRVRAFNAAGSSGYSNEASATTLGSGGNTPPTATITQPVEGQVFATLATITFAGDATDAEDGTVDASGFTWTVFRDSDGKSKVFATGVKSGSFTGPNAEGGYLLQLKAVDSGGLEGIAEVHFTVSNNPVTLPADPSNLTATAASSSQIDLTWTDNSNNEDGFKIERKTGAGAFAEIASVGAGVTSFSNTGLAASTTYTYRVRAFNSAGNSGYSNEASATTSAGTPTVPADPSNLTASAVSSSQIDLTWTDNSNNEDGFTIERKTGTDPFAEIDSVGAGVTSYSNTGLATSTTYTYRVRAFNSTGNSGYSNEASATTLGAGNTPPTPSITAPTEGQVFGTKATISFAGDATDAEDGTVDASGFTWTVFRDSDGKSKVFATCVKSGTFTGPNATGSYRLQLKVVDSGGLEGIKEINFTVSTSALGGLADENSLTGGTPAGYTLYEAFPNPFNPETRIRFALPQSEVVYLRVLDIMGKEIRTLANGTPHPAGVRTYIWDGRDAQGRAMSTGIYFLRIDAGQLHQVRKLNLVK